MMGFPKDWAVRSDYRTDDDFLAEMREVAASDLPDAEKLELLVRKLDVTRSEDEVRTDDDQSAIVAVDWTEQPEAEEKEIVPINMMVTPADRQRLRQLKTDKGISLQKLGHKAWNMLLHEYGLPPLELVPASVREKRGENA